METNINYTLVGAFVITLVSFLVLAIIWLSSGLTFEHYSNYLIYMQESVSGLNLDSPVEFNGVDVGTVTSVELDHKNPQMVALMLKLKSTTPVTQGTVATLNTRGVTGITYVALKDKSTDLRPLVAIGNEPYPVIKTAPSLFMRIDTALNRLSTNLQEVTQSIQSVLDKENQQSIKGILNNLERVTDTLATNSQKMDMILHNTYKASRLFEPLLETGMRTMQTFDARIGSLLQASNNTMKSLETQTLPATYRLLSNLNDVTRNLTEVSSELKQNPSMLIRGTVPQLGPGEAK